ncbi:hypothetical protein [Erwinia sp. V71]|uniref:hypothetical protein n=1 Tax=Erwinia sp. V71 TaxID=3369424 RepID=UPI003F618412
MRASITGSGRLLIAKLNHKTHLIASGCYKSEITRRLAALDTVMTFQPDYVINAADYSVADGRRGKSKPLSPLIVTARHILSWLLVCVTPFFSVSLLRKVRLIRWEPFFRPVIVW